MRTRSKSYPNNSNAAIPRRQNTKCVQNIIEPEIRTIEEVVPMANRIMEELLQAPTKGYGEAIVIPKILAENFEIKTNLLQLVQTKKFHGFERDNSHTHISNFKRMTSTLKYRDVPNDAIKLMLFSYSLERAARIWYEKEPPNSILTWDDLVNQFFLPSKTTHLKNEKFIHSLKDLRKHLERHGNDSRKCLEHVPTMDSRNFEADPRVPLILGRSFLRTGRALIDVYGEEITLRVNDESVTFNLNQTMRYSFTYDDNSVNRIDVIDIACEEYAQDVLDFKYNSKSGNLTLVSNPSFSKEINSEFCKEPVVKSSSPTLTPFGESDFLLEEIEDFLNDESIPTGIEDSCYDPEGDILYLAKLLNDDPSQLPPIDLKQAEETKEKSSIEEPSELELKELPSYLEYAFLEETDKLHVIIVKDLKDDEKEALL
uniref:Reverse transcriptase domain-containing protein n=1 Tax=Tanacetum cinerariifolium TaxID=118510 RepID=A0A6L2MEQ0_TANCI|nr:reverse transcriptase domain-containing protein [Tanacetum cinerariifolium]